MIMRVFVLYKTLMELTLVKYNYVTRSACTEFLSNISEVMKDEIAEKLRGNNFLSAMADGGTDQGVMEEVLVYIRYLDMGRQACE